MDKDLLQYLDEKQPNNRWGRFRVLDIFSHLITTTPRLTPENIEALQGSKRRMCESYGWDVEFLQIDGIELSLITHPLGPTPENRVDELQLLHNNKRISQNYFKFGFLCEGSVVMSNNNSPLPFNTRSEEPLYKKYCEMKELVSPLSNTLSFIIYL